MHKKIKISCFKPSGIYGKVGAEITPEVVYRIARAFGQHLKARSVVLGYDTRTSSEELKVSVSDGLMDAGAEVINIGVSGTEEVDFATRLLGADGGIIITGCHYPNGYNGLKIVGRDAGAISPKTLRLDIRAIAESGNFYGSSDRGICISQNTLSKYIFHLLTLIKFENIKPLKILTNSHNGPSARILDEIEQKFNERKVPVTFIKLNHQSGNDFPNGAPNPLLRANLQETSEAVIKHKADFGVAWDGDFCCCHLFDEKGRHIEGYYLIGLLAELFLKKAVNQKIIIDPRVYWNTEEVISCNGGIPVRSQVGDAYIRESMRKENAVYGGDMLSHHYFRDFGYSNSGMIPWLLVTELISVSGETLSDLVEKHIDAHPISGEINVETKDRQKAVKRVYDYYHFEASKIDKSDGLGMEFESYEAAWRFNIRASDSQTSLKLNVESEADSELIGKKITEIAELLK